MNYDIKIDGQAVEHGVLEFDRLNQLTKSTKEIATKALMLKLRGYSDIAPDKALKKALAMRLEAIKMDGGAGTLLTVDCATFSETIRGLQFDLFKPKEELLGSTPMSLVIHSFQAALDKRMQEEDLDKPLLKALMGFQKNFNSEQETFSMANRGSVPELRLTKSDFQKIKLLDDSIAEPQWVMVNGQLDEMKLSKGRLGLQTAQGFVLMLNSDGSMLPDLVTFMGKELTVKGMAHFKPNGQLSFVEVQEFQAPGAKDAYFSKKPAAVGAKQQLLFQAKKGSTSTSLEALKRISGLLKEDISDEAFEEMIAATHK